LLLLFNDLKIMHAQPGVPPIECPLTTPTPEKTFAFYTFFWFCQK